MRGMFVFILVIFAVGILVSALPVNLLSEKQTLLVKFKTPGAVQPVLQALGCQLEYRARHLNLVVAKCPVAVRSQLEGAQEVETVSDDEEFAFTLDFSAPQVSAPQAWDLGYNGTGVNISFLDSGINKDHPALQGKIILERDFTDENNVNDTCGHGTFTASVVVSVNDTFKGVAHGASLFNAKIGTSECKASTSRIIQAIDWSAVNNAKVISLLVGGRVPVCSDSTLANYVNTSVAEDNVQIIVGSGNGGPGNSSMWTPGCAENAITVGAVDDSNNIASFSSRGPVNDGRIKPDVVAPGVNIWSANSNGNGFSQKSGTSMSTPHVVGMVALMFQVHPTLNWNEVKDVIKATATDLNTFENWQGKGLANASKAVNETFKLIVDHPGLMAYYNSSNRPVYRDLLENDTPSAQKNLLSLNSSLVWVRTAASPVRDETIIVTQDSQNKIVAQFHMRFGPDNLKVLTPNAGNKNQRRFDVAYESQSGRAVIVFADNTSIPRYEIWNGSQYVQNGPLVLESDLCTDKTTWIQLASNPNKNEMVAAYRDASGNYCAQVWNGSAWGGVKYLGLGKTTNTEQFGVAYEQQSGQALVVFETTIPGVIQYCEWDGAAWCLASLQLASLGSENHWIEMASQRGTNKILIGAYQLDAKIIKVAEWSGSAIGTWATLNDNVKKPAQKIFDVAYVGMTGNGMAVWDHGNDTVPSYSTCSGSNCFSGSWSSRVLTTNSSSDCGEPKGFDYLGLVPDKLSDKVLLYGITEQNHYKCVQVYNGTAWGAWHPSLGNGAAAGQGEDFSATFDGQ